MKPKNTRDYGKNHARFRKDFADGGGVGAMPPAPMPDPGIASDMTAEGLAAGPPVAQAPAPPTPSSLMRQGLSSYRGVTAPPLPTARSMRRQGLSSAHLRPPYSD